MATTQSRTVLDWLRTWSVGKLDAIGRTDIIRSVGTNAWVLAPLRSFREV